MAALLLNLLEVVEPESASDEEESVESSDDKDSEIESDAEVETEDAGKVRKSDII